MCMFNNCNTRCNCERREDCNTRREDCNTRREGCNTNREGCWNNNRCGCGCGCNNNWWNTEETRSARLRQAFREGYEAGFRVGIRACMCRCNAGIMPMAEAEIRTGDCGCNSCE